MQSSLASAITQEEFPKRCPGVLCQDKVPSEVSKDLFVALQKYVAMTREQGGCDFKMAQYGMQICGMIRQDHRKMEQLKIATKKVGPLAQLTSRKFQDALSSYEINCIQLSTTRVAASSSMSGRVSRLIWLQIGGLCQHLLRCGTPY